MKIHDHGLPAAYRFLITFDYTIPFPEIRIESAGLVITDKEAGDRKVVGADYKLSRDTCYTKTRCQRSPLAQTKKNLFRARIHTCFIHFTAFLTSSGASGFPMMHAAGGLRS